MHKKNICLYYIFNGIFYKSVIIVKILLYGFSLIIIMFKFQHKFFFVKDKKKTVFRKVSWT